MRKADEHRNALAALDDWEPYLLEHSGLPGPRANLELAQAVADVGTADRFDALLRWTPDRAPAGTADEFLAFAGTVGLGSLAAAGDTGSVERLKRLASDPRWRIREAVGLALQRVGAVDMRRLLDVAAEWSGGNDYERRACIAAVCEPPLLRRSADVREVARILDRVTAGVAGANSRRNDGFKSLRQTLGYCWSVAIAASPADVRPHMEAWLTHDDADVRRIMRDNLSKKRIHAASDAWVSLWQERLARRDR